MARKSKLNAGVIGLGIIGSRIAENLRKAGYQVYVWNRSPKPAPNFLASPAEVAGICDIIQIVVADSVALFSIIDGMRGVLSVRHTVICSSTVGTRATVEAAQMVEACGAKFVDAPFTGSKMAAEKGELVYFIGGTGDAFRNAEPVLKATSKAIVKIGDTGSAATVKIATNMLAAVTVQTLVEACALLGRSGIDPAVLSKALEHHGARSGLSDTKLPKIIAGDYDTHFSVKHMFKDVQLAIQSANRFDIDIPATTATAGALYNAINQGWADMDYAAVAKFYEVAEPPPSTPATTVEPVPAKEAAAPEPQIAEKPAEASTSLPPPEPSAPPVEKKEEPAVESQPPAAVEPQPATPAENTPEPASAAEKPKRPLPPAKPEKSASRWFGSGRKAL